MNGLDFSERLVAILAADAAGYSRLMAADQLSTVQALEAARAVFRRQVHARAGRVVDMAGDSVLAVFEAASSAAACALAVQHDLARLEPPRAGLEALRFRIGVHLSDVIERADGTVYGDGVNVAARLQELAEPGGVVISDAVRSLLGRRLAARTDDLGPRSFKNIVEPVHAYRLVEAAQAGHEAVTPVAGTQPGPDARQPGEGGLPEAARSAEALVRDGARKASPQQPSIAVLPFVNTSADPDNHHFSDGLSEELINALVRLPNLRVIARTSSFAFKGKAMQVRDIATALGVEHVLEGSVRKSGTRVRVTAQLVRAGDDTHVWSQTYDRQLDDIFAVQDEIAQEVLQALGPRLADTFPSSTAGAGTRDVAALEHVFRGSHLLHYGGDVPSLRSALGAFESALVRDPSYGRAHCLRAMALIRLADAGDMPLDKALPPAEQALSTALAVAPELGEALALRGNLLFHYGQDVTRAAAFYERAIRCAPGEASVRFEWSHFLAGCGRVEEAIQAALEATLLDPYTPETRINLARVLMAARQFARAEEVARQVVATSGRGRAALGRCLVALGRPDEALECFSLVRLDLPRVCGQALACASAGRIAEARSALVEMEARFGDTASYQMAQVLSVLADRAGAIAMLERARRTRDGGLMGYALLDTFLDSLRAEPRFIALLRELGLPPAPPPAR